MKNTLANLPVGMFRAFLHVSKGRATHIFNSCLQLFSVVLE